MTSACVDPKSVASKGASFIVFRKRGTSRPRLGNGAIDNMIIIKHCGATQ